jgi:hypothetical protein
VLFQLKLWASRWRKGKVLSELKLRASRWREGKGGEGRERRGRCMPREEGAKALQHTAICAATGVIATYVWKYMKHLKYVSEILAETPQKHLKTIANIRNIQLNTCNTCVKHIQHLDKHTCNVHLKNR